MRLVSVTLLSALLGVVTGLATTIAYEELHAEEGTTVRYALVLPDDFEPSAIYPVLLALPPGPQNREMVEAGLQRYWGSEAARRGWIVVSPVAPGGKLFFQGSERLIPALLDAIHARFHLEGGKFHLAGVSNGGRSAFRIALRWPERFQSLTVLPGFPPTGDDFDHLDRLRGIPIHMFAGGEDPRWVEQEKATAKRLKQLEIDASLQVFPGEGHVPRSITAGRFMDLLESLRPDASRRP